MKSIPKSLWSTGTVALTAAALLASLSVGFGAAVSNTIPHLETYEGYAHGTLLNSNHGWYAEETNALVINTNFWTYTNSYGGILPFTNTTPHFKVVELNSTATNLFVVTNALSGNSTYRKMSYVDMMIKPRRWTLDDPPTVTGNVQMASYFDSNGIVWAWAITNLTKPALWLQMDNAPIDTNAWIRFTVSLGYNATLANNMTYQIQIDGMALKNRWAAPNPNQPFPGLGNGSWLGMPYRTKRYITSATLQGTGYFDDMCVQTNTPYFGVTWIIVATVSNAVITPSGNVPVINGNNKTFNIADKTGYDVTNVVIKGTGYTNNLGAVPNYTFVNVVTSNHTIHVQSKPENRKLVVVSQYGIPTPSGTNTYTYNSSITARVGGSPVAMGSRTQMVCSGWARTTSVPLGPSAGTSTTFNITGTTTGAVTTLTWSWIRQHKLAVTVLGSGTVSNTPAGTWFATNDLVTLTAYTNAGATFVGWSGSGTNGAVWPGAPTNMTVMIFTNMFVARNVTATFIGGATHTTNGTPYTWIQSYYPGTNNEVCDLSDTDRDGMLTWEEYLAGTNPKDSNSVFEVMRTGVQNGSNYVVFYGGFTNAPDSLTLPFGMYRATNLTMGLHAGMTLMPNVHIPRASNGTNWFWEATPTGPKYFYRPAATND